jgi:hypothetical protein
MSGMDMMYRLVRDMRTSYVMRCLVGDWLEETGNWSVPARERLMPARRGLKTLDAYVRMRAKGWPDNRVLSRRISTGLSMAVLRVIAPEISDALSPWIRDIEEN